MLTFTLGSFLVNVLTTLFIFTCIFLVLVILIQKPKGGGLSGAFGGAGGGGAVFGAKAGDALTWFTVGAFACFLLLAIALVYATRDDAAGPIIQDASPETEQAEQPVQQQQPAQPQTTVPPDEEAPAFDFTTPQPDAEPATPQGDAAPDAEAEQTPPPTPQP